MLGLGFEQRTLHSVKELIRLTAPAKVYAVQYPEPGKSKEILDALATRRLDGSHQIADIIQGVKFKDGEKLTERAA